MSTSLLATTVLAQNGAGGGSGLSILVLQMAAIGLVFYFLILRPSGQARKRHAELLTRLKKGDEVMTSGGIIGRVKDIKEVDNNGVKEVRVTVESGTSTVVVERSRIVRVGGSAAQAAPPA
ncbi:MAG: preprotein translocase subunit YajC [Gemmatimonadales bacterium]